MDSSLDNAKSEGVSESKMNPLNMSQKGSCTDAGHQEGIKSPDHSRQNEPSSAGGSSGSSASQHSQSDNFRSRNTTTDGDSVGDRLHQYKHYDTRVSTSMPVDSMDRKVSDI